MAASVLGLSTAVLNFVGLSTLDELGVKMPPLDYRQGIVIVLVGMVVSMAAYLKKHPVPEESKTDEKTPPPGTP